jgi:hypothetical protein
MHAVVCGFEGKIRWNLSGQRRDASRLIFGDSMPMIGEETYKKKEAIFLDSPLPF